jgi:hypothetical protein
LAVAAEADLVVHLAEVLAVADSEVDSAEADSLVEVLAEVGK